MVLIGEAAVLSTLVPNREPMTDQPKPNSVLRLSFDSYAEYQDFAGANGRFLEQVWRWHETLGNRPDPLRMPGLCDVCDCPVTFCATPQKMPEGDQFTFRVPWWSSTVCDCGMSNLDRAVLRVFLDGSERQRRVYHVGYNSRVRHWLSERFLDIVASQFEEGRRPGEIENGIRYEDLTGLSFAEDEFDCAICMEVLEHIPDYHAALRELARTLKPEGRALLSFPWLGGDHYDHFIRAELLSDGSVHHFHPPEYHGDPDGRGGILSFRSFGWKILDEMRSSGFGQASARFLLSPLYGYMTLAGPVIVGVR